MARPEGLEPPTPSFEGWCSVQLSYGRTRLIILRDQGPEAGDQCRGSAGLFLAAGLAGGRETREHVHGPAADPHAVPGFAPSPFAAYRMAIRLRVWHEAQRPDSNCSTASFQIRHSTAAPGNFRTTLPSRSMKNVSGMPVIP